MNTITVRRRTAPNGEIGWEAVTIADIVTTHTIGLRLTAAEVVAIVERMIDLGAMEPSRIVVTD